MISRSLSRALVLGVSLAFGSCTGAGTGAGTEPAALARQRAECEPGHRWSVDEQRAVWTAGLEHPDTPHLRSGIEVGEWFPDPGYVDAGESTLRWCPGLEHPAYRGVLSAQDEGEWVNAPGWEFLPGQGLLSAWRPGLPHPEVANVRSREGGYWGPEPGYRLVDGARELRVEWTPGLRHPLHPHVKSHPTEGSWTADPGFVWVSDAPGDLRVKLAARRPPPASAPTWRPSPDWEEAVTAIVVAVGLDELGRNLDDGSILGGILRGMSSVGRDEALAHAVQSAFPGTSPAVSDSIADLVGRAADGRMRHRDWSSSAARREVLRELRAADPGLEDALRLAELVCEIAARVDR